MLICGIDPGLKGGIALYTPTSLEAFRTPTESHSYIKKGKKTTRDEMDLCSARDILNAHRPDHVFLEHVTAMARQGVTGMFRFGQNLGQWQGLIIGLGLHVTLVRPQIWKKHHGLIGADKDASIELARTTWPDAGDTFKYKRADEGRAEAALIAMYGWETLNQD